MVEHIQPLNGQILVEHIDKSIQQTNSGLYTVTNENARNLTHEAIVIKVHPASNLKPKDKVFYTVNATGTNYTDSDTNKKYKFMREADLLASLSAPETKAKKKTK